MKWNTGGLITFWFMPPIPGLPLCLLTRMSASDMRCLHSICLLRLRSALVQRLFDFTHSEDCDVNALHDRTNNAMIELQDRFFAGNGRTSLTVTALATSTAQLRRALHVARQVRRLRMSACFVGAEANSVQRLCTAPLVDSDLTYKCCGSRRCPRRHRTCVRLSGVTDKGYRILPRRTVRLRETLLLPPPSPSCCALATVPDRVARDVLGQMVVCDDDVSNVWKEPCKKGFGASGPAVAGYRTATHPQTEARTLSLVLCLASTEAPCTSGGHLNLMVWMARGVPAAPLDTMLFNNIRLWKDVYRQTRYRLSLSLLSLVCFVVSGDAQSADVWTGSRVRITLAFPRGAATVRNKLEACPKCTRQECTCDRETRLLRCCQGNQRLASKKTNKKPIIRFLPSHRTRQRPFQESQWRWSSWSSPSSSSAEWQGSQTWWTSQRWEDYQ